MNIGAVVEGHGEEDVVRVILKWLGIRHRSTILRAEGVGDLLERARDYADMHLAKGATHVLFFLDADAGTADTRILAVENRLRASLPAGRKEAGVILFIPVHELEAWLLSDEAALAAVLDAPIEPIVDPERAGAVARLDELFAGHRKGYRKSLHAKMIADAARDQRWRRCSSYQLATAPLRSEV